MATDASKVRVAVTGAIMKGATSATAPTGTAGSTTGFTDLGFVGEDGVEIELPDAGDATAIKAWQNGTTVRVIRTPSEDRPTWTFILLESSIAVAETYFGVTVTPGASEGSFEYQVKTRDPSSYIVDVIDGPELIRDYIPRGVVASVAAHTLATGEVIGYGVTIEGERDPVKGYNFKRWATSLKTPA
ncbi:hypothetical protein GCM10023340_08520 [Nocardioides marinquilinus]|uniref:Phage tail protein n=1 Tax=Nocardioides marinquilinus TaxID=1210400 RepID=A0ABP9PDU7_9ACTN